MANQYWLSIAQVTLPTIPTGLNFCAPFPNSLTHALWYGFHSWSKRFRGMFLQLEIKEIRSRLSVSTSGWCGRGDSQKCHTVSWHGSYHRDFLLSKWLTFSRYIPHAGHHAKACTWIISFKYLQKGLQGRFYYHCQASKETDSERWCIREELMSEGETRNLNSACVWLNCLDLGTLCQCFPNFKTISGK